MATMLHILKNKLLPCINKRSCAFLSGSQSFRNGSDRNSQPPFQPALKASCHPRNCPAEPRKTVTPLHKSPQKGAAGRKRVREGQRASERRERSAGREMLSARRLPCCGRNLGTREPETSQPLPGAGRPRSSQPQDRTDARLVGRRGASSRGPGPPPTAELRREGSG